MKPLATSTLSKYSFQSLVQSLGIILINENLLHLLIFLMICEHCHCCTQGLRGQGYHFWQRQTGGEISHFDSLPVCLASGGKKKERKKQTKKLFRLGHCLLATSAAIRVRRVRNKGFYFISFAFLLASGFALQSLRGSLMLYQITCRESRDLTSNCFMTLRQSPYP